MWNSGTIGQRARELWWVMLLSPMGCLQTVNPSDYDKDDTETDETDTDTDSDSDSDSDSDTDTDTDTDTTDPLSVDNDGDGYSENNGDCDDRSRPVNPGADEICDNNTDDNCDGGIDEDCGGGNPLDVDDDSDGWTENQGDCNDRNAGISPSDPEDCAIALDENCDGNIDEGCDPPGPDTGVAAVYLYVEAQLAGGRFSSGSMGYMIRQITDPFVSPDFAYGPELCRATSPMREAGNVPGVCYGCDWDFTVTLNATVASGPYCGQFPGMSAVDWSGQVYGVGFGENYYGLRDTILLNSTALGYWTPFMADAYVGSGIVSEGNASYAEGWALLIDAYNYPLYAYYFYL